MKKFNGDISVESRPGIGSVFQVYLPVIQSVELENNLKAIAGPKGNERILFVDDEEVIAKMNGYVLGFFGYHVATRTSSVEALELFRNKPDAFDLLITDMTMPQLTADRLLIQLLEIRPDIPNIFCTGFSKSLTPERATEIGIRAFLLKPLIRYELAKTVQTILADSAG